MIVRLSWTSKLVVLTASFYTYSFIGDVAPQSQKVCHRVASIMSSKTWAYRNCLRLSFLIEKTSFVTRRTVWSVLVWRRKTLDKDDNIIQGRRNGIFFGEAHQKYFDFCPLSIIKNVPSLSPKYSVVSLWIWVTGFPTPLLPCLICMLCRLF